MARSSMLALLALVPGAGGAGSTDGDKPALTGLTVAKAALPVGVPATLQPAFAPTTLDYTTSVPASVANVSVKPSATCAGCQIFVCINHTKKMLAPSAQTTSNISIRTQLWTNLTIMVTDSSNAVTNYSVNITKVAAPPPPPPPPPKPPPPPPPPPPKPRPWDPQTDVTLKALSLMVGAAPGTLDPPFSPHVFEYRMGTGGGGALPPSVKISAVPNSSAATMEINGDDLPPAEWSSPLALASVPTAIVVVTRGEHQHAYTVHLHKAPGGEAEGARGLDEIAHSPGGLLTLAALGGFVAVGCLGVVLHRGMGRSGGGSGGDAQGPAGERDSWTQQPFYSPGVGAFGEADDDDAEPPPLDLSAPPPPGAPDRSGYEYDRRYDGGLGEAAKDEQARQWDGRYDGLSIGTTIGGEDQ